MTRTTILGLTLLAWLLCLANTSFAAPPNMNAHKLTTAPVIDGIVAGDEAWVGAIPATDFLQVKPNDGQPASQKTEVCSVMEATLDLMKETFGLFFTRV